MRVLVVGVPPASVEVWKTSKTSAMGLHMNATMWFLLSPPTTHRSTTPTTQAIMVTATTKLLRVLAAAPRGHKRRLLNHQPPPLRIAACCSASSLHPTTTTTTARTTVRAFSASAPPPIPKPAAAAAPDEKLVTVYINNKPCAVPSYSTVLEAARAAGAFVPTLCAHPSIPARATCRICLVEVESEQGGLKREVSSSSSTDARRVEKLKPVSKLLPSCTTQVSQDRRRRTRVSHPPTHLPTYSVESLIPTHL